MLLHVHLQDYAVGDGTNPIGKELMDFSLFVDCNPLSYDTVTQENCWLKVMNAEIHAIVKNNTWELTN